MTHAYLFRAHYHIGRIVEQKKGEESRMVPSFAGHFVGSKEGRRRSAIFLAKRRLIFYFHPKIILTQDE